MNEAHSSYPKSEIMIGNGETTTNLVVKNA